MSAKIKIEKNPKNVKVGRRGISLTVHSVTPDGALIAQDGSFLITQAGEYLIKNP